MAQQNISSHPMLASREKDEQQRRQIRLIYLIVLIIWTLTAIITPIVLFSIIRSYLSFSLFSILTTPVYLWYRVAKYAFMDERMYELEKMKIQRKTDNIKISR